MVRIAFVYDAAYPYTKGGVERRIYELSKRLSKKHEVHLFCLKFWEGGEVIERDGVHLHGVCSPPPLYTKKGRRSILGAMEFAVMLLPALLKEEIDVIDCQNFPYFPVFSCRLVSLVKRSKLFVTWHEFWGDYWYEYLGLLGVFGKIVEKLALLLSPNIISVSEFTKRKLKRKIHIITNGIDYASLKKAKPLKKKFDVIFIGRLIKEKNVDLLLKAVSILKAKNPNIKCCVIGEGPEKEKLIQLASSLKLERNVEFHNFLKKHEEVFSYLKSAKVLVIPSSREGFGMIAVEANACGLPVLTVDSPNNAVKELIREGVNGKVVPLSENAVADGINQLIGKRVKIKLDSYKWENIAEKLEEVYNENCNLP